MNITKQHLIKLLDKPKIIGLVSNPNEGKSNLLYFIIDSLKDSANIAAFGLRKDILGVTKFNTIIELEEIRDSLIIIDEFASLIDVDNRKAKRETEEILRMVFHNNNIIILSGIGVNFKKFISGKLDIILYKKVYYDDLINGSKVKKAILNYKDVDNIKGTTQLNLPIEKTLIFNKDYRVYDIPYMKQYDTKKHNCTIVVPKREEEAFKKMFNKTQEEIK